MLDEYVWGEVRRISPEAPVPVVEVRSRASRPGGAANVAANVASLGGTVLLGGVVGDDEAGKGLAQALAPYEISADGLVRDKNRPTTTKTRVVAAGQQIVRLDVEQRTPIPTEIARNMLGWIADALPHADGCIISDYALGTITGQLARSVIDLARRHGVPILVDPKSAPYDDYACASLVKPNLRELEQQLGRELRDETVLIEAGRSLVQRWQGAALLVTLGPHGAVLFSPREGVPTFFSAVARQIYDVTGAGDTVAAVVALALAAGAALEDAVYLANLAAGIVVRKLGTATVTVNELRADLVAGGANLNGEVAPGFATGS